MEINYMSKEKQMITDIQKWSAPAKKAIYSMTSEEKERFDAVISMHIIG